MHPQEAYSVIDKLTPQAIEKINEFSQGVLRTRGGRFGSGMGTLLEALWGYYINHQISEEDSNIASSIELAWLMGHEYNDFACLERNQDWNPNDSSGELLRIEAKSMNICVDESKGHFDEISENLDTYDALLILLWKWEYLDEHRVYPKIHDHFVGPALGVASLRDKLHLARGGTFVDRDCCPDNCLPPECQHHGEPLNAEGRRERRSGPVSRKPSNVSHAANFGGLVRMLKTRSNKARQVFRELRSNDDLSHKYITFIHSNYPNEERNQYLVREWQELSKQLNLTDVRRLGRDRLIERIREEYPNYQDFWRLIRLS